MLGYLGLTVVRELGSDDALVSVAYVFALASPHLVISGVSWSCRLWVWLVPPVSLNVGTPGRPVLSRRNLGMESCVTGSALGCRWKPEGSCSQLFLGSYVLMTLGWSLLGQEFGQKWWYFLCSQVCQHSWETSSLPAVFGYGALWHRISSVCRWKLATLQLLTIPDSFLPLVTLLSIPLIFLIY